MRSILEKPWVAVGLVILALAVTWIIVQGGREAQDMGVPAEPVQYIN